MFRGLKFYPMDILKTVLRRFGSEFVPRPGLLVGGDRSYIVECAQPSVVGPNTDGKIVVHPGNYFRCLLLVRFTGNRSIRLQLAEHARRDYISRPCQPVVSYNAAGGTKHPNVRRLCILEANENRETPKTRTFGKT